MKQLITIFTVISLAATASAQKKAPKKRDKQLSIDVRQQAGRLKKIKQDLANKKKKKKAPAISADDIINRESKVVNIRRAQLIPMQELCDEESDPDEKAKLCFKLATIHQRMARSSRFQAQELEHKATVTRSKKNAATYRSRKKKHLASRKVSVSSAVKIYLKLTNDDSLSNYRRMDEVYYRFAVLLEEDKDSNPRRMPEARKQYAKLIKNYPGSKYVPQAYLRFADYYFEQNSLANAETFYDKVLKFPKSKMYNYALYKKGWVYLNLGQHKRALKTFYSVANRTKNDKRESLLNKASKKDYVRAYAEAGDPTAAKNAFKRVDKSYMWNMMAILGDLYLSDGKAESAIYIYKTLIRERPRDKRLCEWQWYIVQAVLIKGTETQKVQSVENMVKLYRVAEKKKLLPAAQMQECERNAKEVTLDLGTFWHNAALKTKNWKMLNRVERLYSVYIKGFPNAKETPELEYYYAELQWQRAENETSARKATVLWQDAAIAFTEVVEKKKVNQNRIKESAYASVLAWQNALIGDPRPPAKVDDKEKALKEKRIPKVAKIPERDEKMLRAFKVYSKHVKDPSDSDGVDIRFAECRVYYHYNHLDKAIPCLKQIVPKHLEHERGATAALWLIDSYKLIQKPDGAVATIRELKKNKKGLEEHPELVDVIKDEERRAMWAKADLVKDAADRSKDYDDYLRCGDAYADIYEDSPESKDAPTVLWNAGVCYRESRSIAQSINVFQTLVKISGRLDHRDWRGKFPNTLPAEQKKTLKQNGAKSLAQVGILFGQVGRFEDAAKMLEKYVARYGGEKNAPDAMSDAILYRKGIGDHQSAIGNTKKFLKLKGPSKSTKAEALFNAHYIYENRGDKVVMINILRQYLKEWGRHGGIDRQIIAHAKIGQVLWDESCPVKEVDGACIKVKRGRAIAKKRKRSKKRRKGADIPATCGDDSKMRVTVVSRDKRKSKSARDHFSKALKLYRGGKARSKISGKGKEGRINVMEKYASAARFHMLDKDYEDFLSINVPSGLKFDFRKPKKMESDKKRFGKWAQSKTKKMQNLGGNYKKLQQAPNPHFKIAAAARVGQLGQNFTDQILTTPVPSLIKKIPDPDMAMDVFDSYCSNLEEKANTLTDITLVNYKACLQVSTKAGWFNEWGKLCERELGQINPSDFPTAAELTAEPEGFGNVTSIELPITKLAEVE